MKLLRLFVALFLLSAPCSAQLGQIPSFVVPAPSGGGPSLTYINSYSPTYAGDVATVSSASIGSASSGRLVAVVILDGGVYTSAPTVTIGGISATVVAASTYPSSGNGNSFSAIAYANVPTGTTAAISVTFPSTPYGFGSYEVYTITGLSSFTPVGTATGLTGNNAGGTINLATHAGGVLLGGAFSYAISGTASISATQTMTTDFQGTVGGGSNQPGAAGHVSNTAANASYAFTSSFGSSSSVAMSAASWF